MKAWIVVDLGFGDAGKGTVVDALVRREEADLVVRFHGGAQAGHNVVTPDGRHHTFSQFGAGSFVPGVRTLLGPDFLLHPGGMLVEAEHFPGPELWSRTFADPRVKLITPYQQAANRAREAARGAAAHGTCGLGVGECVADSLSHDDTLRVSDLVSPARVLELLASQRERKRRELDLGEHGWVFDLPVARLAEDFVELGRRLQVVEAAELVAGTERVVFEGAQGLLLDEDWGLHPHTTWSHCTFAGAEALLGGREASRVGVTRTYQVRHGAGPFPTEGTLARHEPHNDGSGWQGSFRTGLLDGVLLRYAAEVLGGIDEVALTWCDTDPRRACVAYDVGPGLVERVVPPTPGDLAAQEALGERLRTVRPVLEPVDTPSFVEACVGAPVRLTSWGPSAADKRLLPG